MANKLKKPSTLISLEEIEASGSVEAVLAGKRLAAADHLATHGSMPDWWECGISLGGKQTQGHKGPPPKFADPDDYYARGYEYFEKCAEKNTLPTQSGIVLYLGFTNNSQWHAHARRHPEMRDVHSKLLTMLKLPHEMAISKPGNATGNVFLIKNIPEGLGADDSKNARLQFPFQDKQVTELVGEGGGAIKISRADNPEDAYLKMIGGGTLDDDTVALQGAVDGEVVNQEGEGDSDA